LTLNQWVPGSSPGGCTKENPVFTGLTAGKGGVLFCANCAGVPLLLDRSLLPAAATELLTALGR